MDISGESHEKKMYREGGVMRHKRALVILLAVLLALPFPLVGIGNGVWAAGKNGRYYYNQLGSEAKGIYDAMYSMYEQGIFQTGTQEYNLVENGHISSEQLAAYGGKMEDIQKLLGTARDAFYADYPEVFYVDFSNLSITVSGSDESGYKASLGIGRKQDYFVEGFTDKQQVQSAVSEYNKKVSEIAQGAKSSSQSVREQVNYVNQAIIDNTEYKLDTNCSPGNSGHVRTAYGALIKHESLCEGYARAVKAVLDSMGIPCVLVQGTYRAPDGSDNLHMWNYVQVDGAWYGLDATANDGMKGGTDSGMYLLADSTVMGKNHTPNGVMSGAGFRFTYPTLAGGNGDGSEGGDGSEDGDGSTDGDGTDSSDEIDSEGYKTVFNQDDLVVKYKDGTGENENVGIFLVSYKGMGYQEAVDKEKVYILARFYQYMPGTDSYEVGRWGYADPKPFVVAQPEHGLLIPNGNSKYIEFAVTKYAPKGPLYGDNLTAEELERNWNFQGTEKDFMVYTDKLTNPKGTFVPSPFAKWLTPGATGYLTCGKAYEVKAVYNETLETYDGQEAGYKLEATDGWSAVEKSKIEDFKWDGDRTITFRFTPSEMLADNYATYTINITGLRGVGSHKAPDSFGYSAKKKIAVCAYWPQGIKLNLGAKAELVEPSDLSYNGWMTSDGKPLTDVVGKLTLVASKPELKVETPKEEESDKMTDMIEDKLGDTIVNSATYNLRLMTCNKNIIQTGDSVRLHIGFPEGFDKEVEGVTYKAYHFITDKNGNITGVEELECITTEFGLMITCNSFSPFAIAQVQMDEEEEEERVKTKKVLVLNSEGGEVEITGNGTKGDKIWKLSQEKAGGAGSEISVKITAKDGYLVDKIVLSNKGDKPVTNAKSMELKIKYADLADYDNILDVGFAVESPKNETASVNSGTDKKTETNTNKKSDKDKNKSDKEQKKSESSKPSEQGKTENQGGASSSSSGNGNGGKTDSKTTKAPAASSQEQAKAPETPQESAKEPKKEQAKSSTSGSKSSEGQSENDGQARDSFVEEETGSEEEVSSSSEEYAQLASPPAGGKGVQEITDADVAGNKSGIGEIVWTIVISLGGAGVVVGGLAAYVKMKGHWTK